MKGSLSLALFALSASLAFTGCTVKPTRTQESQKREFETLIDKSKKPIVLTENTVVLDARATFDYGLNRVEGSHHMTWESLSENVETGEILRDRRRLAQRLSLFGITPTTPIVVVGYGPNGDGQEGRLAWMLVYLGYQDVQTASLEMFRKNWTQKPTAPPKNVEPAEIEGNMAMVTSRDDFRRLAKDPKGRAEAKVHIIDVRNQKEYFNKSTTAKPLPDINALNIEWKEFYGTDGRPNVMLRKKIKGLGIGENDRIILVSNRGVRSGAAAYSLISLGFNRVENFLSGWRSY